MSSLETLRGLDPRVLDAAEHDFHTPTDFSVELSSVNTPLALSILGHAKKFLTSDVGRDQAYLSGVQEGIAIASHPARNDELALFEADATQLDTIDTPDHKRKFRITRWLGTRAVSSHS